MRLLCQFYILAFYTSYPLVPSTVHSQKAEFASAFQNDSFEGHSNHSSLKLKKLVVWSKKVVAGFFCWSNSLWDLNRNRSKDGDFFSSASTHPIFCCCWRFWETRKSEVRERMRVREHVHLWSRQFLYGFLQTNLEPFTLSSHFLQMELASLVKARVRLK